MFKQRQVNFWMGAVALAAVVIAASALQAKKPAPPDPPDPPPPPPPAISYAIISLGTLGGDGSSALGMNASGDVVGFSGIATGGDRAFVYTSATGMVDLNSLLPANSGWVLTWAGDINDSGQIVGAGMHNGNYAAYCFTPASIDGEAVYLDGDGAPVTGSIVDLGSLGSPWAEATAINNLGVVVGAADNADGSQRAFIWTPTTGMQEIVGDYQTTRAEDVNDLGEVVGNIRVDGELHAFRYTPGLGILDLGYIKRARGGGSFSYGYGLNDSGQVAGVATAGGARRAFRYTDGVGMENLGALDSDDDSWGDAINANGDVVGTSGSLNRSFLFTDTTGMLALWPLIFDPPTELWEDFLQPWAINDTGQICGDGVVGPVDDSSTQAVLLTPITN